MKNLSTFVCLALLGYVSAAWIDQEQQRYNEERIRANMANLVGSNQHYYVPNTFPNLTRKFVLQYPYTENHASNDGYSEDNAQIVPVKADADRVTAEEDDDPLNDSIKSGILRSGADADRVTAEEDDDPLNDSIKSGILRLGADADRVTAEEDDDPLNDSIKSGVLRSGADADRVTAEEDDDPLNDSIKSGILRSGDYWNGVWVDGVDPKKVLRQAKKPREEAKHKVLNVVPGTELYRVINKLRKTSPKLIYVINNK